MILQPSLSSKYYMLFEFPEIAYEIFNIFYNVAAFCIIVGWPMSFPCNCAFFFKWSCFESSLVSPNPDSVCNDDGGNG